MTHLFCCIFHALLIRLKHVPRQQKLTTEFFKLFEFTILVVNISISRKKYAYRGFQGVIF